MVSFSPSAVLQIFVFEDELTCGEESKWLSGGQQHGSRSYLEKQLLFLNLNTDTGSMMFALERQTFLCDNHFAA